MRGCLRGADSFHDCEDRCVRRLDSQAEQELRTAFEQVGNETKMPNSVGLAIGVSLASTQLPCNGASRVRQPRTTGSSRSCLTRWQKSPASTPERSSLAGPTIPRCSPRLSECTWQQCSRTRSSSNKPRLSEKLLRRSSRFTRSELEAQRQRRPPLAGPQEQPAGPRTALQVSASGLPAC
jgi:hypothetical protein